MNLWLREIYYYSQGNYSSLNVRSSQWQQLLLH